jgi:hypothetical protein
MSATVAAPPCSGTAQKALSPCGSANFISEAQLLTASQFIWGEIVRSSTKQKQIKPPAGENELPSDKARQEHTPNVTVYG